MAEQSSNSLEWVLGQLHDRTSALDAATHNLESVLSISATLVLLRQRDALCHKMLKELCRLVGADNGSVMLLDDTAENLEITAHIGLPDHAPRKVPVAASVAGKAMGLNEPLLLHGIAHDRSPMQRNLRSSMVIPVVGNGRPVGVVNLNLVRDGATFDDSQLRLAATIITTFGAALEAVQLQEASRTLLLSAIRALALAIEAKDPYTKGHCERVAHYSASLAQRMGLDDQVCEEIEIGATLHDVGKIGVSEAILLKPGRLTDEEFDEIRQHPSIGAEIIRPVSLPESTFNVVLHHHERIDGRGYPAGLKGPDIPLPARIVCVTDAFDAMTISRPYRGALTFKEAIDELNRCAGTQFDKACVEQFTAMCHDQEIDSKITGIESGRHREAQKAQQKTSQAQTN